MRRIISLLAIVLTAAIVWAGTEARPSRELNQLKAFYQEKCARCHGEDGSGHSPSGKKLRGLDFTDANEMMELTDKGMAKTIRKGIFFGMRMPGFKSMLNGDEIAMMITDILRTAEKGKKIEPTPPTSPSK